MGRGERLRILLLADDRRDHAGNVLEHIRALQCFSRHRVDIFNPRGVGRARLLRLDDYDAVVIHYTILVLSDAYLSPWFCEAVAGFGGLKAQFIQDEYRWVDAMTARMRELGIGVLFSSVPADAVPQVYGSSLPGVDVLPTLTGYAPAELEGRPRPPLEGRPLDVVYRGRSLPYWLGRLGQEKVVIGREFLARAASTGLRCDIGWTEAERIYGDDWYRFLGSARATLGTESGASIVDFDGTLQKRTESYLREHPGATFEELQAAFLAPFEGNAVIQAISPRVFEAAALGTAMVNFTGRYSEAIEPWIHYVPLEKDFSNFAEVVAAIEDDALLERLAAHAHSDLVASGRYSLRSFVEGVDRELEERSQPARKRPRPRAVQAATRSLLAVEQLRAPSRRAEVLPLAASLRARALGGTERGLIRRFPEIEALESAELRYDLVRLAAAAAAHLRELRYLGAPFDVRIELDDGDRRLMLVGTREPSQNESELEQLRRRASSAIREGRLEEIVWDNSAVEPYLTFPSVPVSSLVIGFHMISGAHRFTALTELSRRDPDGVIAALEPLFRERPQAPVDELDSRRATLLKVVLQPGLTVARGTTTARAVLASKELRRLMRAYLGSADARREASIDLLLEDLFRLRLVGEAHSVLELDPDCKTLVYRTNGGTPERGAELDPETVRSLEHILWDDEYEFRALTLVARRFPELAAPALAGVATTS